MAFKRRYLDHLPAYVTPAMQDGRDVHAHAQAFLEGKPSDRVDTTLAEAFDALKQTLTDPTGVEKAFFTEWDDGDLHVIFEGRLDWYRLDGVTARIVDLKSGFGIIAVKDLAQDLQARTYALLLFREFPWLEHIRFEQAQLRYHGRLLGTDFTRENAEAFFVSELQPRVREMATDGTFLPNPMCDRCPPGAHLTALDPYRKVTVHVRDGGQFDLSFDPILSNDEFQTAAFGWLLANRIAGALKVQMDQYTDERGPVQVTADEVYGPFWSPERVCSNVGQAIDLLKTRFPDDWQKYVRLDLAACKGLLGDGRKAMPELQALMVEQPAVRHGLRKHKPQPIYALPSLPSPPEPTSTLQAPAGLPPASTEAGASHVPDSPPLLRVVPPAAPASSSLSLVNK